MNGWMDEGGLESNGIFNQREAGEKRRGKEGGEGRGG